MCGSSKGPEMNYVLTKVKRILAHGLETRLAIIKEWAIAGCQDHQCSFFCLCFTTLHLCFKITPPLGIDGLQQNHNTTNTNITPSSQTCCMPCPAHPSPLNHPNKILQSLQHEASYYAISSHLLTFSLSDHSIYIKRKTLTMQPLGTCTFLWKYSSSLS